MHWPGHGHGAGARACKLGERAVGGLIARRRRRHVEPHPSMPHLAHERTRLWRRHASSRLRDIRRSRRRWRQRRRYRIRWADMGRRACLGRGGGRSQSLPTGMAARHELCDHARTPVRWAGWRWAIPSWRRRAEPVQQLGRRGRRGEGFGAEPCELSTEARSEAVCDRRGPWRPVGRRRQRE